MLLSIQVSRSVLACLSCIMVNLCSLVTISLRQRSPTTPACLNPPLCTPLLDHSTSARQVSRATRNTSLRTVHLPKSGPALACPPARFQAWPHRVVVRLHRTSKIFQAHLSPNTRDTATIVLALRSLTNLHTVCTATGPPLLQMHMERLKLRVPFPHASSSLFNSIRPFQEQSRLPFLP